MLLSDLSEPHRWSWAQNHLWLKRADVKRVHAVEEISHFWCNSQASTYTPHFKVQLWGGTFSLWKQLYNVFCVTCVKVMFVIHLEIGISRTDVFPLIGHFFSLQSKIFTKQSENLRQIRFPNFDKLVRFRAQWMPMTLSTGDIFTYLADGSLSSAVRIN